MHRGSCVCGAVRFEVDADLPPMDACHCTQCRKFSGHYFVATDVPRSALTLQGEEHVRWYQSSDRARRGFCAVCGASLFFDPLDRLKHDWTAVAMGAFDDATNTQLQMHIFVSEKGDYYELVDGLPQHDR